MNLPSSFRWTVARLLLLLGPVGCSTLPPRQHPVPWVFRTSTTKTAGAHAEGRRLAAPTPAPTAAMLVERELHHAGLRFGTDGSVGALFAYMKERQRMVPVGEAAVGDILFFDDGEAGNDSCGRHTGVVESVDASGRITFREVRGGALQHSYLDPAAPGLRRDERGQVRNSFLRVKRPDDGPLTRYFAGQMVCAVGRVEKS